MSNDNPKQTAEVLIGEEAVQKLHSAHIAPVWERDQVTDMADRIRRQVDIQRAALVRSRERAQCWAKSWKRAAKHYREAWMMQDMLADLGHAAQLVWMERTREARDWAGRMIRERDALQVELDEYRDWDRSTLGKALLRIADTDEAFVKLRDERDEWQAVALAASETIENMAQDCSTLAEAERDKLQTKLDNMTEEYRKSEWNRQQNFDLAVTRRDERDKLQAELEECRIQAEKSHAAWVHGREEVEALREELKGECDHNERLQARQLKDSHAFHAIQDELVEERNKLRVENETLKQERDDWQQIALDIEVELDATEENYQAACRHESDAWGRQIAAEAELDRLEARRCETCEKVVKDADAASKIT